MKNILITGGSRGIGAEMVKAFSQAGYRVFFTYKNSVDLAQKLSEETGATALCGRADEIKSKINVPLYAIINNAGIAEQKMFQDITAEDWDAMFDTNIRDMFLITKAFINDMIHNKEGRIINISSIWGISGASCEVHYSASKAAVIGFTKALAKEMGPSNITVNCIAPGVIDTDMNKNITPEIMEELKDETPLGRIGTPNDITQAALYLCSDGAAFVTGQVMTIDGGFIV